MEFSKHFDTVKSGWSMYLLRGQRLYFPKSVVSLFFLKIDFVLANSADPDEMPHYAAFHLGLHCLPRYPITDFSSTKG